MTLLPLLLGYLLYTTGAPWWIWALLVPVTVDAAMGAYVAWTRMQKP